MAVALVDITVCWLLVTQSCLLGSGYRLRDVGYLLLALGYWLLVTGSELLVIGYWLRVIGGLPTDCELLVTVSR